MGGRLAIAGSPSTLINEYHTYIILVRRRQRNLTQGRKQWGRQRPFARMTNIGPSTSRFHHFPVFAPRSPFKNCASYHIAGSSSARECALRCHVQWAKRSGFCSRPPGLLVLSPIWVIRVLCLRRQCRIEVNRQCELKEGSIV